MHVLKMLGLFFSLVWREYEPKSCGIPDEYRIHCRLTPGDAWDIAVTVWGDRGEVTTLATKGLLCCVRLKAAKSAKRRYKRALQKR